MNESLRTALSRYVDLSEPDMERIAACFKPRRLRKRQLFLQEGDSSNRFAFVETGAMYSYTADLKGHHVVQFAFEGNWIGDLLSYSFNQPSKRNIEALEDAEILVIERSGHEGLLREVPGYETYFRCIVQNAYALLQERLLDTIGRPAEERYSMLLYREPRLMNRVPQSLIASYLGITRETLSRVRCHQAA